MNLWILCAVNEDDCTFKHVHRRTNSSGWNCVCPYKVSGNQEALLIRDWLKVIRINWSEIFKVEAKQQVKNHGLQRVLEANKDVFQDKLGTLQGMEAKIYVDEKATPPYFKARSVPYALKKGVGDELERWEKEGIISPVEFSEWTALIIPVMKTNGDVRTCGEYK